MRVYVGQTRSAALIARLTELGWGEMTARGCLLPRREPWAYDNGAFSDWTAGLPFDAERFKRDLDIIETRWPAARPDFIVVPDIVAGGERSLEFSLSWLDRIDGNLAPRYLAVQDGMTPDTVAEYVESVEGLFIGGSSRWKARTAAIWIQFAREVKRPIHLARVGTERKARWAAALRPDSIDSCFPLWSEGNLARFQAGLTQPKPESPHTSLPEVGDVPW